MADDLTLLQNIQLLQQATDAEEAQIPANVLTQSIGQETSYSYSEDDWDLSEFQISGSHDAAFKSSFEYEVESSDLGDSCPTSQVDTTTAGLGATSSSLISSPNVRSSDGYKRTTLADLPTIMETLQRQCTAATVSKFGLMGETYKKGDYVKVHGLWEASTRIFEAIGSELKESFNALEEHDSTKLSCRTSHTTPVVTRAPPDPDRNFAGETRIGTVIKVELKDHPLSSSNEPDRYVWSVSVRECSGNWTCFKTLKKPKQASE